MYLYLLYFYSQILNYDEEIPVHKKGKFVIEAKIVSPGQMDKCEWNAKAKHWQ